MIKRTVVLLVEDGKIPVHFHLARMDELSYVRDSLANPDNEESSRQDVVRWISARFRAQRALLDFMINEPTLMNRYLLALAHDYFWIDGREQTEAVLREAAKLADMEDEFDPPPSSGLLFYDMAELLMISGEDGPWDIDAGDWGRARLVEQDRSIKEMLLLVK